MSTQTESFAEGKWHTATVALIAGILAFSVMGFLATLLQTGPVPSPEVGPLWVYNITAATISYVLLQRDQLWGATAAGITGILVVVSVVIVGAGIVGSTPAGRPLPPIVYAVLGIAVLITAYLSR